MPEAVDCDLITLKSLKTHTFNVSFFSDYTACDVVVSK